MIAFDRRSRFSLLVLLTFGICLLSFFAPAPASSQINPLDSSLVCREFPIDTTNSFFKVIANPGVGSSTLLDSLIVSHDSLLISPQQQGYYRIFARVHYENLTPEDPQSSLQKNESFYLLVRSEDGRVSYPLDANVAAASDSYKVVVDDSLVTANPATRDTTVLADAGAFFFRSGRNTIILYHYAKIAQRFPEFLVCTEVDPAATPNCRTVNGVRRMNGRQSVEISVFIVSLDRIDLQLTHRAETDTNIVVAGNSVQAVAAGDTFSYMLTFKNNGPRNTARDFFVADTIPAALTPVFTRAPVSRSQVENDSVFVWKIDSLAVNAIDSITFEVSVPSALDASPLRLFSSSQVDAQCDSFPENNFASTTVYAFSTSPPLGNYDLAHTQTASEDTVFAGEEFSYSLEVRNLGPQPALNFTLSDTIPALLVPEFAQRKPDTRAQLGQDSVFVWNFASLNVLVDSAIIFNVRVPASLPSLPLLLLSRSFVNAANDTALTNNFASTTVLVISPSDTTRGNYDLAHTLIASADTIFAGEEFSYSLDVQNLGPQPALNFTLSDTIPALLVPEFIQRKPDTRAQLGQDSVFVWNFASLNVLVDSAIIFNVRTPASLPSLLSSTPFLLLNRSFVNAASDTALSNNFASTTVLVINPSDTTRGNYDLAHTQIASEDTVVAGEEFSYSLEVRNLGPQPALNFTLSDTIPALLVPEFAQRKPDTRAQLGQDSVFVWNFASLNVLADSAITFNVRTPASLPSLPLPFFSRSFVNAANDTALSNNFASTTVLVISPSDTSRGNYDLAHTQTASEDTVVAGEEFSYVLNVRNLGPQPALNFSLSDTIPALLVPEFIQRKPDARNRVGQDSVFVWNFASLNVLADSAITFNVRVPASLPSLPLLLLSRSFVNAANDTALTNNFASTTVLVINPSDTTRGNYDLTHTQTASEDTVVAGEEFSYSLNVQNLGPQPAFNFTLSDTIPALLVPEFIQRKPDTRAQLGQDSIFVWNFVSLDVLADSAITFNVRVPASLPSLPLPLLSRSLVDAAGDTIAGNNFSSTIVQAIAALSPRARYDLALNKTASADTVIADGEYSYQLEIENLGPGTARNITLWDALPRQVTFSDFSHPPAAGLSSPDTLFWKFDAIAPNTMLTVSYKARVANEISSSPLELLNVSMVSAPNDSNQANNFASARVIAISGSTRSVGIDCYLDRNVFDADREPTFGINFELNASSVVRLDIFDLTGTHIIKLTEQQYAAGLHTFEWNGLAEGGNRAGSGLYMVTIQSANLRCLLKFMVVR